MKLSKTQQMVIDSLKHSTDVARKYDTPEEWYNAVNSNLLSTAEDKKKNLEEWAWWINRYNEERNGIAIFFGKLNTLKALERFGLIEIVEYRKWKNGSDKVKLLNY